MSTFFRDYLYIPLGGNRVSKVRWIFNVFVVWFATGLWHGASWNFVLWGLYFGLLLVLEKIWLGRILSKFKVLPHIWTMFLVIFGWVIFTQETMTGLGQYIKAMFGGYGMLGTGAISAVTLLQRADFNTVFIIAFVAAIVFSTPIAKMLQKKAEEDAVIVPEQVLPKGLTYDVILLVLLFLCTVQLASGAYNPFIYFRF